MAAGTATVTYDPATTNVDKLLSEFKTNKQARFDILKQGEKPKYDYHGKDETLRGQLAIKGKDAGANVVARIVAHRSGEPAERVFNLIATGEMATTVEEVRKKGLTRVTVHGILSEEGFKVSKIVEN